jgi:hypothetical protein
VQSTYFFKVNQTFQMGKLQDVDSLARSIAEEGPSSVAGVSRLVEEEDQVIYHQDDEESPPDTHDHDQRLRVDDDVMTLNSVNVHGTNSTLRWFRKGITRMYDSYLKLRFQAKVNLFDDIGVLDGLRALDAIATSNRTEYSLGTLQMSFELWSHQLTIASWSTLCISVICKFLYSKYMIEL